MKERGIQRKGWGKKEGIWGKRNRKTERERKKRGEQ